MNDYWNDPPEEPEMPECCDEVMMLKDNGDCVCETCGKVILRQPDIEPTPDVELPDDFWDVQLGPACSIDNPDCESCQ